MRLMDSRSRIRYASIVFIIALLVAENVTVPCSAVVAKDATSEKKEKKNDFLQRIERKKKELRRYLKKDGSWELNRKTAQLPKKTLEALKIIRELRSAEFVDLLVPRVDVEQLPSSQRLRGVNKWNETFPIYHTLKEIGIPAIPRLVEALKESSPEKVSNSNRRQIIIGTMVHIYAKSHAVHHNRYRVGARMAKTSLEAELEKTEDKRKKSRIQKALKHSALKRRLKEEDTQKE